MRIATMQHPDIFRGLRRPGGDRSSAPSDRGISYESGMTGWIAERIPGEESLILKGDGFSMRNA